MENATQLANKLTALRNAMRDTHDVTDMLVEFTTHDNQYTEKTFKIEVSVYNQNINQARESFTAESVISHAVAIDMLIIERANIVAGERQ